MLGFTSARPSTRGGPPSAEEPACGLPVSDSANASMFWCNLGRGYASIYLFVLKSARVIGGFCCVFFHSIFHFLIHIACK